VEWCRKYIEHGATFTHTIIAFLAVESVLFFSNFALIGWLKTLGKNQFKSILRGNNMIMRDEMLHIEFLSLLIKRFLVNKLRDDVVHNIFKEAVDVESDFLQSCIKIDLPSMNSNLLIQFTKHIADITLEKIGYKKIFFVKNPFKFMERALIDVRTNQFEDRTDDYNAGRFSRHNDWIILENF
jgi:ribonucleotide reductase beta subunit family protein with ferritin-like domain